MLVLFAFLVHCLETYSRSSGRYRFDPGSNRSKDACFFEVTHLTRLLKSELQVYHKGCI